MRTFNTGSAIFATFLSLAASAAVAQPTTPPAGAGAGQQSSAPVGQTMLADSGFVLGAGDVVDIALVGRSDFGARVRVGPDGTVLLPFIGRIPAVGKTALELAEDIRQALVKGGFFAEAVVRAEVVGISSRYVTVLGFVGSPGLVTLDRNYRLSEIVARVGGRAATGADYVILNRAAGGGPQRYSFDALASGGPDQDPVIASGDKIFIPAAENEVFYVSGQVNSPGAFPVAPGMTFRKAIARGGGVTENGSEKKLKVVRNGETLKKFKIDDEVKVGDVITVGERLF